MRRGIPELRRLAGAQGVGHPSNVSGRGRASRFRNDYPPGSKSGNAFAVADGSAVCSEVLRAPDATSPAWEAVT